jgi:catechol 2,3-dioxygenase-like lactoylglutathione lyase family enzyme
MDFQRLFHTGMVVADLAAAQRDVGAALGLTWAPVRRFDPLTWWTPEGGLEEIAVEATYSRGGPQHFELVQGPRGGFFDPDLMPDSRHIGIWVDDLASEVERLIGQGWRVVGAGGAPADGYGILAYLAPPYPGVLVELVSTIIEPIITAWVNEP